MKKWAYIVGAFLLGVIVASSAGTVSAQVKSLIGQKVTGEYTVIVNGKELQDKGAVISGKTNVPLRSLTEALGVDIQVTGKTIEISSDVVNDIGSPSETTNTTTPTVTSGTDKVALIDGKYYTKYELLNKKTTLESGLEVAKKESDELIKEYESLKADGKLEGPQVWEARLKSNEEGINRKTTELEKVNEALKTFE
ncbi:copper amine oxidase [Paenibacillus anaericanus]|uniref:Copper amine oxidase n=1 Tax=Paenibacillus anaericanus TaxID=170367 RepID=A0A433YFE7_9BACL|nr:stalk domain-containing protein [Paenibacillus anaericanus]RUT48592.1 copper amine oxidase [Paenibacillus anaericanus]